MFSLFLLKCNYHSNKIGQNYSRNGQAVPCKDFMTFYTEKLCILRGRHSAPKIENDMPEKNRGFAGIQ